jgi:hypothetical protein
LAVVAAAAFMMIFTAAATAKVLQSPQTKIVQVVISTQKHTANFRFTASGGQGDLSFQCRIDKRAWGSCRTYRNLKPGKHLFSVRAKDSTGQVDPTPATRWFKL